MAQRELAGVTHLVSRVEGTLRPGCGIGDIASMLKTGDLGGKCADLNALYVGLARAVGLPDIVIGSCGGGSTSGPSWPR